MWAWSIWRLSCNVHCVKTYPQPVPLRTDGSNRFAYDTMTHRLPKNLVNVVSAHPEYPAAIRDAVLHLADAIGTNAPIPALQLPAWDHDTWQRCYAPYAGNRWHDSEWFFAETYGFRLLLAACRYFETRVDPFGPAKRAELDSGAPFLPIKRFFGEHGAAQLETLPAASHEHGVGLVADALALSTWGNKADISFAAGGAIDHSAGQSRLLLIDDRAAAARALVSRRGAVHIVSDNSGAELGADLVLALTICGLTPKSVVLHPKLYPTYVSDTTVEDVNLFLAAAAAFDDEVVARFATAVRRAFDQGRLSLAPDDYWCTTGFLHELPHRVARSFDGAAMVIVKGDFNYRRGFRDTLWPPETDPAAALGTHFDYPLLFLRTMKSDCLVGVPPTMCTRLDSTEPGWRTAGKRGVIQLVTSAGTNNRSS